MSPRLAFAAVAALWSSLSPAANAAGAELCPLTDDSDSCSRILACFGTEGRWFQGRAFGRGQGHLSGVIDDGVTCAGTWVSRNAFGLGQADVTCSDGVSVTVYYFYQDAYTGTALGKGMASNGEVVQSWSGNHVLSYFADGRPLSTARMRCGEQDIPLS